MDPAFTNEENSLTLNLTGFSQESRKKVQKPAHNNSMRNHVAKSKGNFLNHQVSPLDEFESGLSFDSDDKQERQSKPYRRVHENPGITQQKLLNISKDYSSDGRRTLPKTQLISSLFKSNPEIPQIAITKDKGIKEVLFSKDNFDDLDLHPHLVSCLKSRFDITKMTTVQEKTIPVLLNGKDALVKSCTGSGKTLAYAVPIIQKLQEIEPKIQRSDGVYVLVILPTRELALQCYECFSKLTKAFTWIVPGYLIGGEKKKSEKSRIRKGMNVLISTPGRLLDHLGTTANLDLTQIHWLVIDEADMLLEHSYEEATMKIIKHCNKDTDLAKRQNVMLSATLSRAVEKLAGISMNNPIYIDIARADDDDVEMKDLVVPSQLKQYVVIVPTKLRLVTLSSFIVDKCFKGRVKALVFMSTQNEVEFHFALLDNELKMILQSKEHSVKFFKLHGNMKQEARTEVFQKFSSTSGGILLCTDVAARGLDLSHVDWIVQYSVPSGVEGYVHRVGRTARIGKDGQSLLFVMPSEIQFVKLLQKQLLNLEEIKVNSMLSVLLLLEDTSRQKKLYSKYKMIEDCATNLQLKFEQVVSTEETLHDQAREAFLSFVKAYASHPKSLRHVIAFKMLHLGHVAKSFCLRESPSQLGCQYARNVEFSSQKERKSYKRPRPVLPVSEFGSGFDSWQEKDEPKKKKSKKI